MFSFLFRINTCILWQLKKNCKPLKLFQGKIFAVSKGYWFSISLQDLANNQEKMVKMLLFLARYWFWSTWETREPSEVREKIGTE